MMNFYRWSFNEPLKINKYGIPEPITKKNLSRGVNNSIISI